MFKQIKSNTLFNGNSIKQHQKQGRQITRAFSPIKLQQNSKQNFSAKCLPETIEQQNRIQLNKYIQKVSLSNSCIIQEQQKLNQEKPSLNTFSLLQQDKLENKIPYKKINQNNSDQNKFIDLSKSIDQCFKNQIQKIKNNFGIIQNNLSNSRFILNRLPFRPYSSLSKDIFDKNNFKEDVYKNLHIDYAKINNTFLSDQKQLKDFEDRAVTERKTTCVWIQLPMENAAMIPFYVKDCGYVLHHSKYPKGSKEPHFLLYKWLDQTRQDSIPHFSSHSVGVGGVVLHSDCQRILLIQEKYQFGAKNRFSFPGGQVDVDEQICDAAIREVREETGIETEFVGVLGFREIARGFRHEQADLYFPCLLKLKNEQNDTIKIDKNELAKAEWIYLKDLKNTPLFAIANQIIQQFVIENIQDNGKWMQQEGDKSQSKYENLMNNLKMKSFDLTQEQIGNNLNNYFILPSNQREDESGQQEIIKSRTEIESIYFEQNTNNQQ